MKVNLEVTMKTRLLVAVLVLFTMILLEILVLGQPQSLWALRDANITSNSIPESSQKLAQAQIDVWGTPILIQSGGDFPQISISPSNKIFVSWRTCTDLDCSISLRRSDDSGLTWGDSILAAQGSPWPHALLAGYTQDVYMAWSSSEQVISMTHSTDFGDTFVDKVRIDDGTGISYNYEMRPDLALDSYGNVYAVWAYYIPQCCPYPQGIFFAKSTNGGNSFGPTVRVDDIPNSGGGKVAWLPSVAVAPNGVIYVVWADHRDGTSNGNVYFTRSNDGGTTFESARRVNDILATSPNSPSPQLAIYGNEHLFVVWNSNISGNSDIYFTRSVNGGDSFEPNLKLNDDIGVQDQDLPAIAVGSSGQILVSWFDSRNSTNSRNDIYTAVSTDSGISFGVNARVNTDETWVTCCGWGMSYPAFDNTGRAHIVWSSGLCGGQTCIYYSASDRITQTAPDRLPVVFIPGFMGSHLGQFKEGNSIEELWPAANLYRPARDQRHSLLSLAPNFTTQEILVTDAIRQANVRRTLGIVHKDIYGPLLERFGDENYIEYVVGNDPNRRREAGCDDEDQKSDDPALNPTLFVFAYDWRQNNEEAAYLLAEYIHECVQRFHPNSNVNIVAHSMGGLVAHRYILDHPETHNVDKLITIGTPWLGAPRALYSLLTGEFDSLMIDPTVLLDLAPHFRGVHQLLPSESYVTNVPNTFTPIRTLSTSTTPQQPYTYEQIVEFLDRRFSNSKPGSANLAFHTPAQDDWRSNDSEVTYFIIWGNDEELRTVHGVKPGQYPLLGNELAINPTEIYKPIYGPGDDTVPVFSASRILGDLNLNGPATVERASGEQQTHLEMTQNLMVQDRIFQILSDDTPSPQMVAKVQEEGAKPAYYLTMVGIGWPTVSAITNSISLYQGGDDIEMPGRISTLVIGEDVYSIVLDKEQSYVVDFRMLDSPAFIEVAEGIGMTYTQAIRYLDLNLTEGITASLLMEPDGSVTFSYDADGNGSFESTIKPTAIASGEAANDVEPPNVVITSTVTSTTITASIKADDSMSGVAQIYYSLDELNYVAYATPVQIPLGQSVTISAFADDGVGNRSSIVSFEIGDTQNENPLFLPSIMSK